ncbi:MAG: ComEC/Rec2 family competence protein [Candidatus Komeilibacteria bacterium]
MFTRQIYIIISVSAFMLGIYLAGRQNIIQVVNFKILLASFFIISLVLLPWRRMRWFIVIFFMLLLGIWRWQMVQPAGGLGDISSYGQKFSSDRRPASVHWQGQIIKAPVIKSDAQSLVVAAQVIERDGQYIAAQGQVAVKAFVFPEYHYGDLLDLECVLYRPDKIEDFAYDEYLAKQNIYTACYWPRIKLIASGRGYKVQSWLIGGQTTLRNLVKQHLVEPEGGLIMALLLGDKSDLADDVRNDFQRLGAAHILAISGMHIGIISGLLWQLLIWLSLPRRWRTVLAIILISAFVILVGAPPSAIRAAILWSLILLAQYYGAAAQSLTALAMAALAMLWFNPRWLLYDLGWQLSFMAVLSLLLFAPAVGKYLRQEPGGEGWRALLQAGIAAQIITLPWVAYKLGQVSLLSLLANIVLVPLLPPLLILSLLSILFSWLPIVGQLLWWLTWLLSHQLLDAASNLNKIPWGAWQNLHISLPIVLFYYLSLLTAYCFLKIKKSRVV